MYTGKDKKEVAKNYFSWKGAKEKIVSLPKEGIELDMYTRWSRNARNAWYFAQVKNPSQ